MQTLTYATGCVIILVHQYCREYEIKFIKGQATKWRKTPIAFVSLLIRVQAPKWCKTPIAFVSFLIIILLPLILPWKSMAAHRTVNGKV